MSLGRAATRAIVTVAVLASATVACGDDGPAPADDIAATLLADPTFAGYDITATEARCIADAVQDALGDERVAELRPAGEDAATALDYAALDDGELTVVGDAVATCVTDADGSGATDVVAGAVADGVLVSATDEFPVTDTEAACIGDSVVASLGTATMVAVGIRSAVDAADLDADESEAFVAAFLACTDVRARVLAGIGGDPDNPISDEVLACLDANITDEQVDELFALGFAGDDADADQARADEVLADAIATCA